jgi:nicotinamidase-related amidase
MSVPAVPISLKEVLRPDRTAVIVWDMQVSVIALAYNASVLGTPNAPVLRKPLDALLRAARDSAVRIVWSHHSWPPVEHTAPAALRSMMRRQGVDKPSALKPMFQAGDPGLDFVPGLAPLPEDLVIEKTTPSFFVGTPLELRLRTHGITTLVLTGVATEAGIELTARHAGTLGFFVVVAEDCVAGFTAEAHAAALARLRSGADVVQSAAIVEAWSR